MPETKNGITIEFQGRSVKFDNTVDNINKALKVMQREAALTNQSMKFDGINKSNVEEKLSIYNQMLDLNKKKLAMLQEQLKGTYEIVEENGKQVEKVTDPKKYESLMRSIQETERNINNLDDGILHLKETQEELNRVTNFDKWSESLKNAGSAMDELSQKTQKMSAVAQTALTSMVTAASDYESAFAGVKKTVEETDTTTYEEISDALMDLAGKLPIAQKELAAIAEVAGQLGVGADDISKFTEVMAKLGMATNLTGDEASTAIARLYNIMGGNLDTVDKFASALTELGNNAAATESEILDMATRLAAAGSQVGMTEADVLGLSSALAGVGLKAEQGGTALSRTLTQIDKDVAKNTDNLQDWADLAGMSAEEFAAAWQSNVTDTFIKVITGMAGATEEGGNLNVMLDELGINAVRQTDAMKRLVGANDLLTDSVAMANNEWEENSALNVEVSKRNETFASKLQILKNRMQEVGIKLGNMLLPFLEKLISVAEKIIDKVSNMDEDTKALIVTVLAIVAAISPIAKILGGIFSGLGSVIGLIKTIAPFISAIISVLGVIWNMGIGGKIALITAAVVLLVEGIKSVIDWAKKAINWLKDLFGWGEKTEDINKKGKIKGSGGNSSGGIANSGINMKSGGFGVQMSRLRPLAAGGFGEINLSTSINVTNSGTPINATEIRRWGTTIADVVSKELGRRM